MVNRLGDVISPYLRSHADNPVDWFSWGEEAFAEARRRDVPVLVSIGYSTCHWCHVMARESFSDPVLAAQLNAGFVAIKVDREEHPDVDSFYIAAAGAFTQNLGWPLNVFTTPDARPFFGGTYSPPVAVQGNPSFSQVLGAVNDAWVNRRADVEDTAQQLTAALAAVGGSGGGSAPQSGRTLVSPAQFEAVTAELEAYEDTVHGGFGGAPKFPVAPVLSFLLRADAPLALRTLKAMAASDLRDPVEGGFFRYATRADWSDPHYERMLYDNALLLEAYTSAAELVAGARDGAAGGVVDPVTDAWWAIETAAGVAEYLIAVLQIDGGGFASAQDSESVVAGQQSEGGYYALDAEQRAAEVPPKLDAKILTGWNGLAIGALAHAAAVFAPHGLETDSWMFAARAAADYLLEHHVRADGSLIRASLGGRASDARATLEDYGMFALGLGRLASATGEERYREAGQRLVDATLRAARADAAVAGADADVFVVPGGADPVLTAHGLSVQGDVSEGAYPSGLSAAATAAFELGRTTGRAEYLHAARAAVAPIAAQALARPIGFGATLELLYRLTV